MGKKDKKHKGEGKAVKIKSKPEAVLTGTVTKGDPGALEPLLKTQKKLLKESEKKAKKGNELLARSKVLAQQYHQVTAEIEELKREAAKKAAGQEDSDSDSDSSSDSSDTSSSSSGESLKGGAPLQAPVPSDELDLKKRRESNATADSTSGSESDSDSDSEPQPKKKPKKKAVVTKDKKRKHDTQEEDASKKKPSKKSRSSKGAAETQEAAQWNVNSLGGGAARQDKFMRLLGGKRSGAMTGGNAGGPRSDSTKAEAEIQRQFEEGMVKKNEGGNHRRGLGA